MDVTYQETVPFYPFSPSYDHSVGCEGKKNGEETTQTIPMIITLLEKVQSNPATQGEDYINRVQTEGDPTDHEERVLAPIQQNIQHDVQLLLHSTYEHITEESITTTIAPTNASTTDDSTHDANNEGTGSLIVPSSSPSPDCSIALRKEARKTNIPARLKDCVGYKHDIANFVSYEKCSPSFKGFIASLDNTSIPKDWKEAFHDPKWNAAMLEEMEPWRKIKHGILWTCL
jgi:hypothetical protein